MPRFKCSFIFRQSAQGWTESWYTAENASSDSAFEAMSNLAPARSLLLGTGAYLAATRVSDVDRPRASGSRINNSVLDTNGGYPDVAGASIVCEVRGESPYRKVFTLRGFPDDWIKKDPNTSGVAILGGAQGLLTSYVNQLRKFGLMFKQTDRTDPLPSGQTILNFGTAAGRLVVTVAGLGALVGDRIGIKKAWGTTTDETKRLNKTYFVDKVEGNDYHLRISSAFFPNADKYFGGTAYRKTPTYVLPVEGQIIRAGERRVGRAFFQQAGRRKRR